MNIYVTVQQAYVSSATAEEIQAITDKLTAINATCDEIRLAITTDDPNKLAELTERIKKSTAALDSAIPKSS